MSTPTTSSLADHMLPQYRVRVALAVHLFDLIDYTATLEQFSQIEIGGRVLVPWRQQQLIGIAVEKQHLSDAAHDTSHLDSIVAQPKKLIRLKAIIKPIDTTPLIDTQMLRVMQWAAQYYQAPVGEVVMSSIPKLLRSEQSALRVINYWIPIENPHAGMPKPKTALDQAWQTMRRYRDGIDEMSLTRLGISLRQLKYLQKRGLIRHHLTTIASEPPKVQLAQPALVANAEQRHAIDVITATLGQYQGFLLNGITGSGKTEVYLQVMQAVLARGQQVLVLVPEIGLTPQTIERFQARFHVEIAILHSNLNHQQRLNAWQAAREGHARIVLGTRLSIFTPMTDLGLIVIDEEHDLSYKQQDHFRYHARDVGLYRAYQQHCPIILGSATPSFESLALSQQGKLHLLTLQSRAGDAQLPHFHLLDLKAEPKKQGVALKLLHAIAVALNQQQQVLVFINRRGYAPVLMCLACGWQADCPHCSAHLTLHQQLRTYLLCHHCGYRQPVASLCPSCQQDTLKPIGHGTVRVEEILANQFPDYPLLRIDRDTTTRQSDWRKIYDRAYQPGPAIFLGTQMLAKGHHFPFVGLVTVLNIDNGLWSADFRAPERTAQLLMQVAGRAGRGDQQGHVVLQSVRPDHPLLVQLIQHGYTAFAHHALQERAAACLPPFRYATLVRAESRDEHYTLHFLQYALEQWSQFGTAEVEFWGPVTAPMSKRAGFYRGHLLLLYGQRPRVHGQMSEWWQWLFQHKRQFDLRLTIDVDVQELN